jgi:hypothetical protein
MDLCGGGNLQVDERFHKALNQAVTGLVLVSVLGISVCPGFPQNTDSPKSSRPAVSLEGLLRFLANHENDQDAAAMAVRLIELHGLDFRPTAQDLVHLKNAAASDELLKAIELARKPAAPKLVRKEGKLEVACLPVDCTVWLDGKQTGITKQGALSVSALEGSVSVAVMRTDYEAAVSRQEAIVRQNQLTRVQFQLRPSLSALVARGTCLFEQMLKSLGAASSSLKQTLRVTGKISLQTVEEHSAEWALVAWIGPDNLGRFDVSRDHERYEIRRTDSTYIWKKRPKSKAVSDIEDGLRLFMSQNLPQLMHRLQASHLTTTATDLISGPANTVIRAETVPDVFSVHLDSAGHPDEIKIESSGLDSGTRIVYSDYTETAGGAYPRFVQVVLPDGRTGVTAQFDDLEVGQLEIKHVKAAHK